MKRTLSIIALALAATAAQAQENPCRGLPEQECKAKQVFSGIPACTWTPAYATASGMDRKGSCRASRKRAPEGATRR